MNRGRLLVFEGIDGCGKSTQLRRLAAHLRERDVDPVVTHEPTDGAWGRRIRAMARSGARVAPAEELAWFVEDRREHVATVIEPSLAAGRVVLCDRYFLSTVAYQGARGLVAAQALLAQAEAEFPLPDLALVFEIAPAQGLARVAARGGVAEPAFEQPDYLARVAAIFASLDRPYVTHLDSSAPVEVVHAGVLAVTRERLGLG